jgi:hypothetical protein
MILPPRPENHPRPEPSHRALALLAALDPHPRPNRPELDRFAPPPWDRLSADFRGCVICLFGTQFSPASLSISPDFSGS